MAENSFLVGSKPNCQQCRAVKRRLEAKEVPFTEISLVDPDNEAYLEAAKAAGMTAAPVIFTSDGIPIVSGFRPDKLRDLEGEAVKARAAGVMSASDYTRAENTEEPAPGITANVGMIPAADGSSPDVYKPWDEFIRDYIKDRLEKLIDTGNAAAVGGSWLHKAICRPDTEVGFVFVSKADTQRFIINHWKEAEEFYSIFKASHDIENTAPLNPFDNADQFLLEMIIQGVRDKLAESPTYLKKQDMWIDLTDKGLASIRQDLGIPPATTAQVAEMETENLDANEFAQQVDDGYEI